MDSVGLRCPKVRPFLASDRADVTDLLRVLPVLYPGGEAWLHRRLNDVLRGSANCAVVQLPQSPHISAAAICTPKPNSSIKLSTFFVAEDHRRHGLGSLLLEQLIDAWDKQGVTETYVTVPLHLEGILAKLIGPAGFIKIATEKHRYGPGRHEAIWVRA